MTVVEEQPPPPSTPPPAPAAKDVKETSPMQSILMVSVDQDLCAQMCTLVAREGAEEEIRTGKAMLDGSISWGRIKTLLKHLGWRNQKGNPCYVVVPSEDVLILIEEFPTRDPQEIQTMAESRMQGLVELEQEDHTLSVQTLHRGETSTTCALAIFNRQRIEKIYEALQQLRISNPRFIVDLFGDFRASCTSLRDGHWGTVFKDERNGRVVVKALRLHHGIIQNIQQRVYSRPDFDPTWLGEIQADMIPAGGPVHPETGAPLVEWQEIAREGDPPQRLAMFTQLAAHGKLSHFELQPTFWLEHLRQQQRRKTLFKAASILGVCYGLFILYLAATHLWLWTQTKWTNHWISQNQKPFEEAERVHEALSQYKETEKLMSNPLELLKELTNVLPEEMYIRQFQYAAIQPPDYIRTQQKGRIDINGTSKSQEAVYTFVTEVKKLDANLRDAFSEGVQKYGNDWSWTVHLYQPKTRGAPPSTPSTPEGEP